MSYADYCRHRPDPEPSRLSCPTCDNAGIVQPWRLVQNSTGRVIRTFASEDDAWFYQQWDGLYPASEYTICEPEICPTCKGESKR